MALKLSRSAVTRVVHVLLLAISLTMAFVLYRPTLFAWHPTCMAFGYILFMAEGLVAAIAIRHAETGAERVLKIQSHALLQLRAIVLITFGFAAIVRNKVWGSTRRGARCSASTIVVFKSDNLYVSC